MAGEVGVRLLPEQLRLQHLAVQAVLVIQGALVGEEVHVNAALGAVHLGHLEGGGREEGSGRRRGE